MARNESLIEDMARELGSSRESLVGSFDLIFGVNMVRFCHRLKNEKDCPEGINELLTDGRVCIVIDMNDKRPAVRSWFRDRMRKGIDSCYLPSLDEYSRLRQSRRLYGSRAPQRGLVATQSQNHKLPAATLISDVAEARSVLPELSNSDCLPGRAGGSPKGLDVRIVLI